MLAFRACVLDGSVYFCAPAGMIADHVRAMAKKRGLRGNSKLNWLTVMDAGSRVRVEKYIEAAQKKGIYNFVKQPNSDIIVNTQMNVHYHLPPLDDACGPSPDAQEPALLPEVALGLAPHRALRCAGVADVCAG